MHLKRVFSQAGKERDSESGLDYFGAKVLRIRCHSQRASFMLQALQLHQLPAVETGITMGCYAGTSFGHEKAVDVKKKDFGRASAGHSWTLRRFLAHHEFLLRQDGVEPMDSLGGVGRNAFRALHLLDRSMVHQETTLLERHGRGSHPGFCPEAR
jgi:hypothetical protein